MSPCGLPFCLKCQMEKAFKMKQENETITNEQGGSQSFIEADYESVPAPTLHLLAQCLGFGRRKYGLENWKKIPIEDHLSHAMNHIVQWRMGDRSEPHLVNTLARIVFALTMTVESGEQPTRYIHPDMKKSKPKKVCYGVLDPHKQVLKEVDPETGKFTGVEYPFFEDMLKNTPQIIPTTDSFFETYQVPTNADTGRMVMVRQNSKSTWVPRRFIQLHEGKFECLTEVPPNTTGILCSKTTLWAQAKLIAPTTRPAETES
jgi:hypothetical protein